MTRNFGTHGRRTSPAGAFGTDPAASIGSYAPSNSILIPASAPLERSQVTQAALDILCLGSFALLISAVASLIGIFGYVFKLQFFS